MYDGEYGALGILLALAALIMFPSWECNGREPTVSCSTRGSSSIFVASFDDDSVGSLPAPSTPLHYGPPGASVNTEGGSNNIGIANSAVLGSKALRITRGASNSTKFEAEVGDNGDAPYDSGVYFIEFKAHGEVVPEFLIAGVSISVSSTTGKPALSLKLFAHSYHFLEGDSYLPLDGSYDPNEAHFIHIELNVDAHTYSICVDEQVELLNKALLNQDFEDLHALKFIAPPTITEAFEMVYVVDDIRITK